MDTELFDKNLITLDGRMDEPVWEFVQTYTGFRRTQIEGGEIVPVQTEFKVLPCKDRFYIGVKCMEPDIEFITKLNPQLDSGTCDDVEIFLSPSNNYMGYCTAISEAGLEVAPSLVKIGIEDGEQIDCIKEMLCGLNPADGFVCFKEDLAADVVHTAREHGLQISEDVGVIGFEGIISWLDDTLDIRLTYVDISYEESGEAAAQTLWNLIHGKNVHPDFPKVIPPKLIVRDSCKGKRSIRQEAGEGL